jgi:transposase
MADVVCDERTKRNWKAENGICGDTLKEIVSPEWKNTEKDELEVMNKNKPGRPFRHTDSEIEWGMRLKTMLGLTYRMAHALVAFVASLTGSECIGLTGFYERGKSLALSRMGGDEDERILAKGIGNVKGKTAPITGAVDATGLRLDVKGEWIAKRWDKKKTTGWLKLHVVVDVETNEMLAFVITTENCGDNTCFMILMDMLRDEGLNIGKILADAAYDSRANWREMKDRKIDFVANLRKNADGKFRGCAPRGLAALKRAELGEKEWKISVGYGIRWKAECTFSDFKRLFGESLRSARRDCMVAEIFWKIDCLNIWKGVRRHRMDVV